MLLAWIVAEAKAAGYRELLCDTMPAMAEALAMYERAGFERTEPYCRRSHARRYFPAAGASALKRSSIST